MQSRLRMRSALQCRPRGKEHESGEFHLQCARCGSLFFGLESLQFAGRDVRRCAVPAPFESSYVCDDGPPVSGRNLRRIGRHNAETGRDDVEEISGWSGSKPIDMERWRWFAEASTHGHTLPGAKMVVARCAEYVEALPAALKYLERHRKRKRRCRLSIHRSFHELCVSLPLLRNSSFRQRASRASVRKKSAFLKRAVAG